ncbi:acetate--CoA ligase family protein [Nocardioides daeguensis]|uniref:Acetate--CoA ligase family protein n=1 Tax=Nocardioides daeguensis TaxID=908359 RepID=A0ABP6W939_9ACTN|nr:acetate--CoA ligase family protein [Nocardioides daeguensis]MBV6729805.1 acetate--CoA ligase family protein [Nocardioides daeguensis]MCR1775376.1 acetate--CoA ligase family protein [Nocardioides daeguensis]
MTPPLSGLLNPRTLAVIGASRDPNKYGSWAMQHTVDYGFSGRIYGVNRAATPADRDRRPAPLVSSLHEITGAIDCAMITVPAAAVVTTVEQCAERGVPNVIIPSTGFGESGDEGRRAQDALLAIAREAGMRLLGPNCFGVQSASGRVNLTPWEIPTGPIAVASQSGSVAIALHQQARLVRTGFSTCMGIGNQIDVGFGDALEHFAADDDTRAVGLYVEGMPPKHLERFLAGLDACAAGGKTVAVIKAGRTAESAMVAATHTGSLAGDSKVWLSAVRAHGAICVDSPDVMMDVLQGAVRTPAVGSGVFVIADGGGDTALAADAVATSGFHLAALSPETQERLAPLVPPSAPRVDGLNPLTADTPGGVEDDPHLIARILEVVREDPAVDLMVVSGVFGGYGYLRDRENLTTRDLVAMHNDGGPPVAVHSSYALDDQEPVEALKEGGIAVYPSMARLLAALSPRRVDGSRPAVTTTAVATTTRQMPFEQAAALLTEHGVRAVPSIVVRPGQDPVRAAQAIGFPCVLKLADPDIVHKSDVGGVVLDLADAEAVAIAAKGLREQYPHAPLLVMAMAEPGFELLLGVTRDPLFGPVVIVGRGGIWTEVEDDVALLTTPFTHDDAVRAIESLRCAPMLLGHRGRPVLDIGAVADAAVALATLAHHEQVDAVDLNPVLLHPTGCSVVDVRVMVAVDDTKEATR